MSRNKKIVAIVTLVLGFVLLTVGVSSALMNYNRIGSNHQVVLGDIWMSYEETTALTIEDALPGSDYSNYFEFTISGKNTYTKKDIYYDFSLVRGDLPEGKTEENRIPDKYLKFKLVSVDSSNQETVIFTDSMYESLENQRIHVETIKKNTENKINRKYRLYMTIDNSLEIGNLETAVFTMDEWESAFATVKLNVTGDFSEKKVLTYNDCFKTNTLDDGTLEIIDYYKYNASSTNELYQNSLCTSDVIIPNSIDGVNVTKIGNSAFRFDYLSSVSMPLGIISIGYDAFFGNSLTSVEIPNSVTEIDDSAFRSNLLTNIEIPASVIYIGSMAFNDNKLLAEDAYIYNRTDNNNDGIAEIDYTTVVSYGGLNKEPIIPDSVTTIGRYAFYSNELTSVDIPDSITEIEPYAFANNYLTSIKIPDSVIEIQASVFDGNLLTSVEIPDSVTSIGYDAFKYNRLETVVLGSSVEFIQSGAFNIFLPGYMNPDYNLIRKVVNKSGIEFDWDDIFGQTSSNGNNYFAYGTYKFDNNGEEFEILIEPETTPESCFTTTSIDSTSVSITDYDTSCGTNVVIPNKINGGTVIKIDNWAFQNKGLTSVILPNTLEIIGIGAFSSNDLVSVVIPDSVTEISGMAFAYNYLEKVVLGSSLQTLSWHSLPTHSHSYAGNNLITTIVNKSGNAFEWNPVLGLGSTTESTTFVTGTIDYYYNGAQTIEITDSDTKDD